MKNLKGTERSLGHRHLLIPSLLSLGWLAFSLASCTAATEPGSKDDTDTNTTGMEVGSGCIQGQQVGCPCGGGEPEGVQVCNTQSVWDACQCDGSTVGTGGSTDGTGGAGDTSGTGGSTDGTGGLSAGTGGLDGSGGMAALGPCDSPVTDMISDMEVEVLNQPPMMNEHVTRQGPWYSSAHASATITEADTLDVTIPAGRCTSTRAVHAEGVAAGWGAVVGFHFNSTGGIITNYDASGVATGFAFFAKGAGTLRVEMLTAPLDPDAGCTGPQCSGFHGTTRDLTSDWTLYQIPFSELEQASWSSAELAVPLDTSVARGIQFKIETGNIDFWIDDIGFY